MPGHWRQRGNKIELRAFVGRDPLNPSRKVYATKTIPGVSKREADKALATFVADLAAGKGGRTGATVGDLLERWYEIRSADWSPATAREHRWIIDRRLAPLHRIAVSDLSAADLDRFYAALRTRGGRNGAPLSAASIVRVHGVLRLALEQAVKWRWRADNPADDAEPGRITKPRIKPPSESDVIALLMAAETRDASLLAYLFLDAETGARRGELAALRLDDLHGDSLTIARGLALGLLNEENLRIYEGHIWPSGRARGERLTALIEKDNPKNSNSVRMLTLSPPTLELLAAQRQRLFDDALLAGVVYAADGFLFPAGLEGTRPLRPDTWSHRFIRLRDELGLNTIRLHDLRHFVATTLLTSGVDLATVAGRLGHGAGGKTTLAIYSHFVRAPDKAASQVMAEVLKPQPPEPAGKGKIVALRRRESPM